MKPGDVADDGLGTVAHSEVVRAKHDEDEVQGCFGL
eukprot:CAMPEP_0194509866 /NCGR_PEP_ID=MMETSP0253-20130528/41033_1 /TAXON_ID=2966 /ORGANISM="Noctiluca scintillans" /LENGTH=35 /DNA_ID= /DNA_START= /DNA_END= /DNA_ORIENTATION=